MDARPPPNIEGMVTLKVDNLTYDTRADELKDLFRKYGDIGDVYIPRDHRTNESRGFGFVRFYDKRDAEDAMRVDGRMFKGRDLRVQWANHRRPDNPKEFYASERDRNRDRDRDRDRRRSRSRDRGRRRSPSPRRRSRSNDRWKPRDSRSPAKRRGSSRSKSKSKSPVREKSRSRGRSASSDRRSPAREEDDKASDEKEMAQEDDASDGEKEKGDMEASGEDD